MRHMTHEVFQKVIESATIRPRFRREVRFTVTTEGLSEDDWAQAELLPIYDKTGNSGVLLLKHGQSTVYAASYRISRGLTSSTGRAQPIICDFCRTWQTGSRSGSVTIDKPGRAAGSIAFLCCADLQCSKNVRSLTAAARTSRAQLREDMTTEQRVERLERRIKEIGLLLGLTSIDISALEEARGV